MTPLQATDELRWTQMLSPKGNVVPILMAALKNLWVETRESGFRRHGRAKRRAGFVSQNLGLNCLLHWKSPGETELDSVEVQPNKG